MGTATNYLENKLLDHSLGKAAYTMPSLYLALYLDSGPPTEAGTGTEVSTSGTNYGRIAITFGSASGGQSSNDVACLFTCTGSSFGTIGHYALFDASTSGNMLYYGALSGVETIGDGDSYNVPIGAITVGAD